MGLLPGAGRGGPMGGMQMDGLSGSTGGEGAGGLGGSRGSGPRVTGGSRVPGSLRAYVQRYLREIEEQGRSGGSSGSER